MFIFSIPGAGPSMPIFWPDDILLLLLFPTLELLVLLVELRLILFPNKFALTALGVCGDPVLVYCHGVVLDIV